jgi:hypothetical protein
VSTYLQNLIYLNFLVIYSPFGDFNLPNIDWTRQEDLSGLVPCNVTAENEILVCDIYFSLCFNQFNNLRNAYDNVLDLCFANRVSIDLLPSKVGF